MKIVRMLRLILLGVFCLSFNYANHGFLRLINGSIFLKSDSRKSWSQVAADMSLRVGDTWRTSSNFSGTVYVGDQYKSLDSDSTYKLQKDGIYKLQGEDWYPVSVVVKSEPERLSSNNKLRGEITPESHLLIFRQGSEEPSKFSDIQKVYYGDIVQLPANRRAQMIMIDGSRLLFGVGSVFELGHEGIFLRSGSVFSNIRRQLSRFEITTEDALISVRGTIFDVSCSDETAVEVYEGVVKVSNRRFDNRGSIFLEKGKGVKVSRSLKRLSSYSFDLLKRPSHSRKLEIMRNSRESFIDEEKLALEDIQERLKRSRDEGFREYTSVQSQFEREVESDTRGSNRANRKSLQEYLARVAGPGEDADFRIFKGGQQSTGTSKIIESWKDEYREEVQSSTELQRQKVDILAEDYKDLQNLAEYRKQNLSVDLKTKLQQEDFNRRKFGAAVKQIDDRVATRREITSLKKFINSQNLELRRVESEKLKLVREKDRVLKTIDKYEDELDRNQEQRGELLTTLSALRLQKRQLEEAQKGLITKESAILSSLSKANQTLRQVIVGSFGRIRQDTEFMRDSRRRLLGY